MGQNGNNRIHKKRTATERQPQPVPTKYIEHGVKHRRDTKSMERVNSGEHTEEGRSPGDGQLQRNISYADYIKNSHSYCK